MPDVQASPAGSTPRNWNGTELPLRLEDPAEHERRQHPFAWRSASSNAGPRARRLHRAKWHSKVGHMASHEVDRSTAQRLSPDMTEWLSRSRSGQREGHFYAALFGLRRYDSIYLVKQIQHGLLFSAYARFQRNTLLPNQLLAAIVEIPERTLARRKETGRLQPVGSGNSGARIPEILAT